jgi:hypothetical protein
MPSTPGWQVAFVAMTVALGDSGDDAHAALDGADRDAPEVTTLLAALSHPQREVRARTLATTLARVVVELDAVKLA